MITWAYIAGLFDGEGTVDLRGNQRVAIYQKAPECLRIVSEWMCEHGVKCGVTTRKTP